MRFLSSILAAFFLITLAAPTADALMWSSFSASLTKYEVRAATKAKKATTLKKKALSIELPGVAKGGLVFGDVEATTTIVMFTDIECPFCKRFTDDTYPKLQKNYLDTGKVRFVIRHFPLAFHTHASMAARAVLCAREQNDEYARSLYGALIQEDDLDAVSITAAIGGVKGLDAAKVTTCVDGKASKAAIEADIKAGTDAGINGTPSFFIMGPTGASKTVTGAYPYDTFVKAIEAVQK